MYCFYAAHKSERPSGKNSDANWYLKVNFELLNIKITRITKLNVETQYKVKAQPSRFLQQNKTPE